MNGWEAMGRDVLAVMLPVAALTTSIVPLFFIGITRVLPSGDHLMSQGNAVAPLVPLKTFVQTVCSDDRLRTSTAPEGPSAIAAYFSSGDTRPR